MYGLGLRQLCFWWPYTLPTSALFSCFGSLSVIMQDWRSSARNCSPSTASARGFAFQIEMNHRAVRAGLRVVEVPILFCDRERGKSKMSARIFVEGLFAVWRIRFARRP